MNRLTYIFYTNLYTSRRQTMNRFITQFLTMFTNHIFHIFMNLFKFMRKLLRFMKKFFLCNKYKFSSRKNNHRIHNRITAKIADHINNNAKNNTYYYMNNSGVLHKIFNIINYYFYYLNYRLTYNPHCHSSTNSNSINQILFQNRQKNSSSIGQTTMEFIMLATMFTSSIIIYPYIFNALGVYLKSMQVVLNLPLI